ncbi:hypothetical protein HDE_03292 [Halotydeus destructor]|nr:hypothetical protein HDE_03292 [Halotydeus destructor]
MYSSPKTVPIRSASSQVFYVSKVSPSSGFSYSYTIDHGAAKVQSNAVPSPTHNSAIYKLPTRFVSNAKPIRVQLAKKRKPSKKVANKRRPQNVLKSPSKVNFLKLKYSSNAKPVRVSIWKP